MSNDVIFMCTCTCQSFLHIFCSLLCAYNQITLIIICLLCFRGALEAYVKTVSAKGGTEYALVYPVMLELLQKGLIAE